MLDLEYFVVAEGISIDQKTNRVSVFNIFEEIRADTRPIILPSIVAISAWNVKPEDMGHDYQATLRIHPHVSNNPTEFHVNFQVRSPRHRISHYLNNIPFEEAGNITFEILLNGEHKANHIVTFTLTTSEAGR